MTKKVFVLGIDGAPPELIFERWKDDLPNLKKLMEEGCYSKMESTIPPLTCAAWTSFSTGKSSGDHGLFEYVYRKNNNPNDLQVISSENIKQKTFWEILSEQGKKSIIFGVPITWPIKPFNGTMVTGFMTPGIDKEYTLPSELKYEIKNFLGKDYQIDIEGYRKLSKQELIQRVYEMTDIHFKIIKYLIKNKEWDLFFGVLIGSDRMNHNFWRFFDELHRRYEKNEFSDALKNYYIYLDKNIGEILSLLDKDTTIMIVSDHGTVRMHNRVNLSDWLIKEGYLVLKKPITEKCRLTPDIIDWTKTKVSAIGAFEGQIYVNLIGRDPFGIVKIEEYDQLIKELKEKISQIKGDDGKDLDTTIFTRKQDYDGEARGIAPDMVVYFDNLQYGCNASLIGNETLWSPSTAMGTDDAVHSRKGIFIINDKKYSSKLNNFQITEPAKIILEQFDSKLEKEEIKIFCTIGPSSESKEILGTLKNSGMDFARINLSHVEIEEAKKGIDKLCFLGLPTILDTQGKEIRINETENIFLENNNILEICDDKSSGISFSRPNIIRELKIGEEIFIDDEKIILQVEKIENNKLFCRVLKGGELKKNRVVKINRKLNLEPLTERDKKIISYGISKGVNKIALSFADSKEDILNIKKLFPGIEIIPKIENMQGVLNVKEILEESDSIWVDRFDLGTFIGFEKVPLVQKMIIKQCQLSKKGVIIASHLLESMIKEGMPTRAEINDIANTILDGATGLVLAAETAVGKNPVESVKILKKMIDDVSSKNTQSILDKVESSKILNQLKEMGYIDGDYSNKTLDITKENMMDVICLCNHAFSPLNGFVNREDYQSILDDMKLKTGEIWSIPIMLNVPKDKSDEFSIGDEISLIYNNEEVAKLFLTDKYLINKDEYCIKVFGTIDNEHPGVKEIRRQGEFVLAGKVKLIKNPLQNELELSPEQIKNVINERGMKKVVAFHTRNPIHRSHEFIQRSALEFADGLLIHPVIGKKKSGDFNEKYITQSYKLMMENFYPKEKVIFSTLSTYSRYAGPREAVFTALVRKNFGATHFIVGRDHTGVGNFYGKYDSQKIFDKLGNIGIEIIKFHAPYYCPICNTDVTEHTCNHEKERLEISGTQAREMLKKGICPPHWFMRPEISEMIIKDIKEGKQVFVE